MRAPRRSFASPFVVTLTALPVAACNPPAPHRNPPPPKITTTNTTPTPTPTPTPTDTKPPVVMENPPRPTQPDPAPEPAKTNPTTTLSWNVTKKGTTCTAFDNNACKVPAGQPAPPCNPPPPRAAKCPDGLADGASVTVTQFANQADCFVVPPMPKCPANVSCNPPPPRKVACP